MIKKNLSVTWLLLIAVASLLFFNAPALYSQVLVSLVLLLGSAALMIVRKYDRPLVPRVIALVIGVVSLLFAAGLIGFGWIPSEMFPTPVALLAICLAALGPIMQLTAPSQILLDQLEKSKEWIKKMKKEVTAADEKVEESRVAVEKAQETTQSAEAAAEKAKAEIGEVQKEAAEMREEITKIKQVAEADAKSAENMHRQREAALQQQIDRLTKDLDDLLEKPSAESQPTVAASDTPAPTDTEILSALGKGNNGSPTDTTPPAETVAEAVSLGASESGVSGELLIGVDPESGEIIAKETAIPQTSVYLNKIEDNDDEMAFEVCCTEPIEHPLCVGIWFEEDGTQGDDEFFRIAPGETKARILLRVPQDDDIDFGIIDYLHLNPSRRVMDKLGITECQPYTVEVYRSSLTPVEVYAEI